MPDLFWIADLGRASVAAFWIPVAAWTAVALVVEAALRLGKTGAALALPVRGAVLAALPLAVLLPAGLDALVPEAAQAMAVLGPGLMWLPEVAVGAAPEPAGPPVLDVLAGLAAVAVGLAGVLGVLRLVWALVLVGRARQSLAPADVKAQAAVDDARRRLGVARPVTAAIAPAGAAPFTLGWRHPVVALPDDLDADARDVAAIHEMAHVRRADFAWHTAQRAVAAVFAAHPLVWALGRGLDLDRERAADAAVLDAYPAARRTYADLLLSYASLPAPALALGAAQGSSSLKTRIDAMTRPLSPDRFRQLARLGRAAGLLALVLVAGLAATTAPVSPVVAVADRTVEGLITDADTGARLIAANVRVVGTAIGGATDPDGRYRLTNVPDDEQILQVSFVGYETRYLRLAEGETERDVALTTANVPPPPPVAVGASQASAPDVFDVVEEVPQLIGDLEGLQSRVVYPEDAKEAGIEGQVVVQFIVNAEGGVEEAVAIRSPDERLSEAALAAVRASRFEPGRQHGRAVKVRFAVPVMFRLPRGERTEQGSNWGDDGPTISYDIAYTDGLGAFLDQGTSTSRRARAEVMAHVAFGASPFQDLTPGTARLQFRVQDNGRMLILGDVQAETDALSRYARFLALGAQFRSEAAGRSGTMTLTVNRVS